MIPIFPEVIELAAEQRAAGVEHGQESGFGPAHAGLFRALTDDRLAAGFDDAGADEQALAAKLAIAHPGQIFLEVTELGRRPFRSPSSNLCSCTAMYASRRSADNRRRTCTTIRPSMGCRSGSKGSD